MVKGITFEQAVKAADNVSMSSIRTQVKNYLNESFNEFDQLITELKVKDNLSTQIIEGLSSGQEAADSVELAGAKLNLIDNTSHNLQQIFFSNWANSKSINDLLLGDQAVSLKSMVDKVKRAKLSNAAFYSAKSELTSKKLGIKHPSTNFDMIIFDEPLAKSSLTNADIEQADAQVYITTKGIRYATFAFGRLSDGMANMLNTIDAGVKVNSDRIYGSKENTINLSSTQDLLNSKKYVYMNGQTAIKMSVSVLTKEYTSKLNQNTGKWEAKPNMEELHYLREQMESNEEKNQNFAMAGPLSAVKMMKTNVNPLLDDNSGFDQSATLTSVNLETEYLGLQVVNPSNKKEVTDMTQIKEMISSEQDDFVEIPGMGLNEKGEVMKVGDVRRLYNDAIGSRVIIKYKNKRNLVFTFDTALDEFKLSKEKGAITPNLAAFLNYAQTALQSSGTSSTLLEFFSLENGSQKYNLNSPITEKKFAQLFLTYFSKGTLSEKVPGDSFSLVSSFGHKIYRRVFEIENGVPTRSEIIREDQWEGGKPTQNLGDLTNNNIPKEGIVVLDVLRTGVMEYINGESTGLRYSEVIMPPMDKNIMDLIAENPDSKIPDAIAKMFGVRIPSQDKHSAVNMRVVDFMPAYYGSSAIFPKELVEISGADFDIDKVYALMKQYYLNSKKEFVEYGTNNDYFEYIKYTNLEAGKSGSIISDAASLFEQDALAIRQENSLTDAQVKSARAEGPNKISKKALNAMLVLGLPVTRKAFKEYKEKYGTPNEAVLNNKVLDYRYALAGNTGMTESSVKEYKSKSDLPIAYQGADIQPLKELFSDLVKNPEIELFKGRQDSTTDVDSLYGMIKSFEANKGSAIGAVVLPNLHINLLSEYKIELYNPIKLNDQEIYTGFGVREINGVRKQDLISSLVTMETDNANDRYIGKLGINKQAVGLITNAIGIGMPLETAVLLVNSAEVRELYDKAINKEDQFDPSLKTLLTQRINELRSSIKKAKEAGDKIKFVRLNNEFLYKTIDSKDSLSENARLQVLYLFQKINNLKTFTANMGAATNLTKGLPKDVAAVRDSFDKLNELFGDNALANLAPIYKSNTWQSTYLRVFSQIYTRLLPNTLLTMTPEFNNILAPVYRNMDTIKKSFDNEVKSGIEQDLLSYLTIKAYQKLNNESTGNASPVSNTLIYPSLLNSTDLSLVKQIEELMITRELNNAEPNFFLNSFVGIKRAGSEGNTTGLEIVDANTWRRLNAANKVDLQTSFAKLYGALETRDLAVSILHYIMIKDGLQLKYGSLMSAMSPFIMDRYLNQIGSVEAALNGTAEFEDVFGITKNEVINEFKYGYLQSNVVGPLLHTIEFGNEPVGYDFNIINRPNTLVVTDEAGTYHKGEFVRVKIDSNGATIYSLLRRTNVLEEGNVYKYTQVSSMGSNQQFGGGFVGGPRQTYLQTRKTAAIGQPVKKNPVDMSNSLTKEDFDEYSPAGANPIEQETSGVEVEVTNEKYSRNSLDNDSSSMYLFTDNAERTSRPTASSPNITEGWYAEKYKDKTNKPLHYGSTSNPTSAVIRGKNNAYPISTMSAYGTNWTNENFDLFKDTIDDEIAQIKQDLSKFKTLKLGDFRIGQGGRFAKLPSQHQSYLDSKLLELGIDNSGNSPKVSKPTQQTIGVGLGTETAPAGGNVIVDGVKGRKPQPGAVVAFRTKGKTEQNMIDALKDNAVGNPFGPYGAIKEETVVSVTRFLNWLEGKGDTNVMQNYRKAILNKASELKGKPIFYYTDLGRPSHATALDYFLNKKAQPTQQNNQVEISSNAKGLAAALTNPTELAKSKGNLVASYPITFNGKNYKDVEAAYQALKNTSEARTKPTRKNSDNYKLMVDLILTKLEQHPRLISAITKQGGAAWIRSSTHQPTKQNTVWETGGQNWFIESLADAYGFSLQIINSEPIIGVSPDKADKIEKVLRDPNLNINVTNKNVTVQATENSEEISILDPEKLFADMAKNSRGLTLEKIESDNSDLSDSVDTPLPETTEIEDQEASQLALELAESEDIAEATMIEDWWANNVQGNKEVQANLREQGVSSIQDALTVFGDLFSQTEQGQQDLIDRLKCFIK